MVYSNNSLPTGQDLLDGNAIRAAMDAAEAARLQGLEVFRTLDSTNQYLMEGVRHGLRGPWACLAEYQTAGRGRHGKTWQSPFASGLCLSLLWTSPHPPHRLMGLSLALGVALAEILEQCGITDIALKWPNDLYWAGRKLAGLLIEIIAQPGGPTNCVIGLGLNVHVSPDAVKDLDQPWVDLISTGWQALPRNQLAAILLSELLRTIPHFEKDGLIPFLDSWRRRDILTGQPLTIQLAGGEIREGWGVGISSAGALQIQNGEKILCFTAGEVSVRLAPRRSAPFFNNG